MQYSLIVTKFKSHENQYVMYMVMYMITFYAYTMVYDQTFKHYN